ncbi:hypothetical protein [Glutamicibacter creatinolyticus]|uniref:hypothetical protein n=1 Tax=Glutamicibacter creatinolyticus TaxID=162496 RepID=UPI003216A692
MSADLLEVYGFDLQAWIRGEAYASPHFILTLISELPEGSRYVQRYHFDHRDPDGPKEKPDPELEAWMDARYWNGDRILWAQIINAIRDLTMVTGAGKWKKGKEPEFQLVGPAEWREDPKKPANDKAPLSERLHKFFFGG